jgi:hypothetical protein
LRILFDKNVPYPLLRYLAKHDVHTAEELGWARLANGDLLRSGEDAGFEIMVTADQNLEYQQNLKGRKLALVVLSTNHIGVLENWCARKLVCSKIGVLENWCARKLVCSKSILNDSWRWLMRHGKAAMSFSGSNCRQAASRAGPRRRSSQRQLGIRVCEW